MADAAGPPPPAIPREAERRQLTVLFCDLVGSTELSARLDPEEMREVIRHYQNAVAAEVGRFEGHVARLMGDGVLAYFGYPKAHEDDAERAVRAGLAITGKVGDLSTGGHKLSARIGIATGRVVVGDLIGEGAAQEEAVVGETPNLAARLQALAKPDSVVIAAGTRGLLGGLFELADLGAHALKGFTEPVRAWRVMGAGEAESRFDALRGRHLIPLVGRDEELNLLLARWRRAVEGEGQVVLLSGEAGIGKSRIVQALREQLAGEAYTRLSHYCSPYHIASALYPIIGLLERAAGFTRDDPPETRLGKLETLLAQGTERLAEAVPLIADMLGIAADERHPVPALSPQRKAQRTLEVLVEQVEGLALQQPVLALYEDVHWMDPTTLEALGLLIERVQRLPVLVLLTFRPEFVPPWSRHAHVTQLSLTRLTRRQGAAFVARLAAGKALPEEVLDEIVAKTDGIPLFVEELTKTVLESGLLTDAGDHYELAGPLPPLAIPSTLQDSLMARLDRLGPVKEVAQIAAVIGREFEFSLLAAVAGRQDDELQAALTKLAAAELIFGRGTPPDARYTFKHALVRDVAYGTLLKSKQQQLHARIAGALEESSPTTAETEPERLAQHYSDAKAFQKAVNYWYRAGVGSATRSAYAEASVHLARGLETIKALPEGPERDLQELDLLTARGSILINTRGHTSPEVGELYLRALKLCPLLDTPHRAPVLQGLRLHRMLQGELRLAYKAAEDLRDLAERANDDGYRLEAFRALGVVSFYLGEFVRARDYLERGFALYDPEEHREHVQLYENDPGTTCLFHLAYTLWMLGPSRPSAGVSQ